jgi:hypothetical protein
MVKKYCVVIQGHKTPLPDPLIMRKGEVLKLGNKISESDPDWVWCISKSDKVGWVPKAYLEIHKNQCKALQDYNALELTVSVGQEFEIEKEESGWAWVSNIQGEKGWIPLEKVKIVEKPP